MTLNTARRRGFTLLELMVVIGIMLVLVTMGALFLPNLDKNKGVPNGTTQIQGWINLMKMQALRDQAPRGIRLIPDPNNPRICTTLQYIEVPEPLSFSGPTIEVNLFAQGATNPPASQPPTPNYGRGNAILTNTSNPANPVAIPWDGVQPGDYLQISTNPQLVAQIVAINPANPFNLVLDRHIPGTEGNNFIKVQGGARVIRGPRPLVGEPMLQLHKDIMIDLEQCSPMPINPINFSASVPSWNTYLPWSPIQDFSLPAAPGQPNYYCDILFNSYGAVANAPRGHIGITVVHRDRPIDRACLVIYTRTGKVTATVYYDNGGDPYIQAKTGQNPGL